MTDLHVLENAKSVCEALVFVRSLQKRFSCSIMVGA
jgi:hypothetical protein